MRLGIRLALAAAFWTVTISTGQAEYAALSWNDLRPAEAQIDDPYSKLDRQQMALVSQVANVHDRLQRGAEVPPVVLERYRERRAMLAAQGVDVDRLLEIRGEVVDQRETRRRLVNSTLDQRRVRIPGYLLPLDFRDRKVVEFLLVPYVGACIHTPPPPPNQIVHVTAADGFAVRGLYAPVWVSGELRVETASSDLDYVDGTAPIESAYRIAAERVEPYRR